MWDRSGNQLSISYSVLKAEPKPMLGGYRVEHPVGRGWDRAFREKRQAGGQLQATQTENLVSLDKRK